MCDGGGKSKGGTFDDVDRLEAAVDAAAIAATAVIAAIDVVVALVVEEEVVIDVEEWLDDVVFDDD